MRIIRSILHAAPWAAIIVAVGCEVLVDPGYWLTVTRVQVHNSSEDASPKMIVAREVHRPFHGHWTATVKAVDGTIACVANGDSDYKPETKLPVQIDLDWWTFPTKCALPPGDYTVFTSWRWRVVWMERETSILSNIFTITAKGAEAGK